MHQSTSTPAHERTLIVVPCFNEALRLRVEAFEKFLAGNANVALMFVDDGSTDETWFVLKQLRERNPQQIYVLQLATNVGKAEATRLGIQAGLKQNPAMIGYWDADLATPLDAIPRFIGRLKKQPNLKLIMGSRVALLGRRIERRPWRHMIGRAFATCASFVLDLPVYDTQCGAKLFRVSPSTRELFSQPYRSRWVFDVEILARLIASEREKTNSSKHDSIYEYPLEEWCDIAGSHLRPVDFLVAAFDLAIIYWSYRQRRTWSRRPQRSTVAGRMKLKVQSREAA